MRCMMLVLLLLLLLLVLSVAEVNLLSRHHHRHHNHRRRNVQNNDNEIPADDYHTRFAYRFDSNNARTSADDTLCWEVIVVTASVYSTPCGLITPPANQLSLGDYLESPTGVSTQFVTTCAAEGCATGQCLNWVQVTLPGLSSVSLLQTTGWVAEDWVAVVDCYTPPYVPPPMTTWATRPQLYPPLLPVRGDGMCYHTLVSDASDPADLLTAPCATGKGTKIITVPADSDLIPLYVSRFVSNCALKDHFNTPMSWWIKVKSGTKVGWVANAKAYKRKCGKVDDVRCTFTQLAPNTCYRNTGGTELSVRDSPCGTTVVAKLILQGIAVKAGESVPASSTCAKEWLHVTVNDQTGYIANSGLTSFSCNGDGWLKKVGPYDVIRMDKSNVYGWVTKKDGSKVWAFVGAGTPSSPPNKFLLHTIDGGWPRWGDFHTNNKLDADHSWPQFILGRNATGNITIGQYFSIYSTARALEDNSGPPYPNSDGVVQVEIGANANNAFTEQDLYVTLAVRELYHTVAAVTGIPICKDSRVNFIGWNSDGANPKAKQRLNQADFHDVHGLVGHQHATLNSHWDPGQVDPWKLL